MPADNARTTSRTTGNGGAARPCRGDFTIEELILAAAALNRLSARVPAFAKVELASIARWMRSRPGGFGCGTGTR